MLRKALLACAISVACTPVANAESAGKEPVEFDLETLKSLGMDPEISRYFSREARFMPGKRSVTLKINGETQGSIVVTFDKTGQLCFDKSLMEQAGLRIPAKYVEGCYDYIADYPDTLVTLLPAQGVIELVLHQDQLQGQRPDAADFITGGTAGLFNYSMLMSRNNFDRGHSDYAQLTLDGGVNFSDWLFRTHQLISRSNGNVNSENSRNYLQHTFMKWKTTMRAGEVNMNNRLLEGSSIYGIELEPENALSEPESAVQVTGIASTAQARVEVRQQGMLIYSTLVPAGPFMLTNIPLRNFSSELNVTVIETDGVQRNFIVPASLYSRRLGSPAGFSFAAGRVSDNYAKRPWVASVSGGWRIAPTHNVGGGVVISDGYQGLGISLDSVQIPGTLLSLQINQSADREHSLQGQKYQLTANVALPADVGFTASVAKKSSNYRDFTQSIDDSDITANKYEYSAGVSWSNAIAGSLSSTFYETQAYGKGGRSRFISLNWGKNFKGFSLSASWQRQLSAGDKNNDNDDMIYVNLSVPFSRNSLNAYSRHSNGQDRYGLTTAGQMTENSTYNLAAERDAQQRDNSFAAGINSNLHYTQLSLNASTNGSHNNSYAGSLQGGVVAHRSGITFSPLAVHETFAIAQLDSPVPGVRLDTPQGPTWTDFRGQAVIPAVNEWKNSLVEIRTDTLPQNMDIGNGTRLLKQAKGSVGQVHFGTLTSRRVLLTVTTADGKPLPKSVVITDVDGNYLTTSVDDGVVFLTHAEEVRELLARLESGICRVTFALPPEPAAETFYERAGGICK